MYLASLGGTGMRELAALNRDKSEYLKGAMCRAGFRIPFGSPTFNEFVVACPPAFSGTHERLMKKGVLAGLPLAAYYPELEDHYLLCVTETKTREDLDDLAREMQA